METDFKRKHDILRLRSEGLSYSEICKRLGCNKSIVAFYCSGRYLLNNVDTEKQKQEYEELICKVITKCNNINQICKALGKKPTNTNYNFIKNIIKKYDINISHFTSEPLKKCKHKPYTKEEIFTKNSKIKTSKLLNYILKYNLKEYKCENCKNTEWMNKKIPLQTHHINGNNTDNRIENLQLLCPNCHAQTDNYCGKSKKQKTIKFCPVCNKEITGRNKYCSRTCYHIALRQNSKY